MNTISKSIFAAAALVVAASASAQTAGASGASYLKDSRGMEVRSSAGLCWRTASWTPAAATSECDSDLLKKVAVPVAVTPAQPTPAPAAVKPPPPVSEKVTLAADAFFDFNKSVLKPEGKAKLDQVVSMLQGVNLEAVIAVGHTDAVGSDAFNQKLSERRAQSVKAYLVSKGVDTNRVFTEGKGESQAVESNKTSDGRAKNRRVEIEVVGNRVKK